MTSNNTPPQTSDSEDTTVPSKTRSSATSKAMKSEQAVEKKAKSGVRLASLAIVISVVLSGGIATYGYKMTSGYTDQIRTMQQQINTLASQKQTLANSLNQVQDQVNTLSSDLLNKTQKQLDQQHQSIEGLQTTLAKMKRTPDDWLLAEADYLLRLAGRKLILERDVTTAEKLVESASLRIAQLNDPSLIPLRQAMSDDATTLKNIPIIDKDGLVLTLNSLEQQVDHLPLANAILPDAKQEDKPQQVTSDISNWKNNLLTSLKDFSAKFITIRVRDGNVVPLLSPKQDFYLRENLKTKLETAIRAVLDEKQDIYQTSIAAVIKWSGSFLNTDDNDVKAFLDNLKKIQNAQVQINYPDKLKSQALMTQVMNQRVRQKVTGLTEQTSVSTKPAQEDKTQ